MVLGIANVLMESDFCIANIAIELAMRLEFLEDHLV